MMMMQKIVTLSSGRKMGNKRYSPPEYCLKYINNEKVAAFKYINPKSSKMRKIYLIIGI